jgi:hypothetical protein
MQVYQQMVAKKAAGAALHAALVLVPVGKVNVRQLGFIASRTEAQGPESYAGVDHCNCNGHKQSNCELGSTDVMYMWAMYDAINMSCGGNTAMASKQRSFQILCQAQTALWLCCKSFQALELHLLLKHLLP